MRYTENGKKMSARASSSFGFKAVLTDTVVQEAGTVTFLELANISVQTLGLEKLVRGKCSATTEDVYEQEQKGSRCIEEVLRFPERLGVHRSDANRKLRVPMQPVAKV